MDTFSLNCEENTLKSKEKLCRACLGIISQRQKGIPLKTRIEKVPNSNKENSVKPPYSSRTVTYLEALKFCTGISVQSTEPQELCGTCAKDLLNAYNFYDKCCKTQLELDKIRCNQSSELNLADIKIQEVVERDAILEERIFLVDNEIILNGQVAKHVEPNNMPEEDALEKDEFVLDTTSTIQCELCLRFFKGMENLRKHYERVHKTDTKDLTCPNCSKKIFSQLSERHIYFCKKRRSGKSKVLCTVCGILDSGRHHKWHLAFQAREKNSNAIKPYVCDICGTSFASRDSIIQHMKAQHLKIYKKCKYCSEQAKTYEQINIHVRKMHPEVQQKVVHCKFCDFATNDHSKMMFHRASHSLHGKLKCKICSKEFIRRDNLQTHMKSHSDERPFACDVCGNTYKTMFHLGQHQTSHVTGQIIDKKRKK
uniref:CSON001763 protein n=1 Tax=Culicoides sonorensis TaxID=179676 RepID=A0A336LU94_CULSO